MRLAVKVALGLAGAFLLARRGGGGNVDVLTYYAQNDGRWGGQFLGNSHLTIGSSGCMMTSLGMAAGALWGADHDFDPATMNTLCRDGEAFSGALLILPKAAEVVDCEAPDDERIHAGRGATVAELRARIDDALANNGVALLNVDKSFTGTGEHFILCHGKSGGAYVCADPATGKDTLIDANTLHNGAVNWAGQNVVYDVVGVAPIYRGEVT